MSIAALTGASLTFEPERHEYRLPTGQVVPSVTQILRATGVSVDFDGLSGFSARLAEQIDYRRALGTAVHADCHAFDDHDLDWSGVHPDVQPYVTAWADFRAATGLTPLTRERRIYHPQYRYCGTLDGIFELPTGRRVLVDIKIGDPEDAGCRYQTAAYLAAFQIEHPEITVEERWGVQLTPERGLQYWIFPYTDWTDSQTFAALVTTYYVQAARRNSR